MKTRLVQSINDRKLADVEHNIHPTYRPDIDGLRAVAILSVVIFHAFPNRLQGGFIGVDIFFVISGFLISSIIFRSLQRGDFSFTEFYAHRVKRIFPALIVVLVACYSLGWVTLLPDEFKQLGKHIATGAGFVQNFAIKKEAGYFDTASELKPLMHLWSLAIEEQFYLIYPLLIWAAWRVGLNVLTVVALLALISFGLNVSWIEKDPIKTFFVPQTRFWELLVGGVVAYVQFFKQKISSDWLKRWVFHTVIFRHIPIPAKQGILLNQLTSVLGFLLIVVSVLSIHKGKLFPGWWATAPVIGAALLIFSDPNAWINKNILGNRLMVFVGIISYPLYLWHWPILSFARIVGSETLSLETSLAAVAASFFLAWLTYRLVERPVRFGRKTWVKTAALVSLLAMVGYAGFNAAERGGLKFRHAIQNYLPILEDFSWDVHNLGFEPCDKSFNRDPQLGFCLQSKGGNPKYALLGDSHADHIFYGLAKYDSSPWILIGNSSCAPVSGGVKVIGTVENCDQLVEKALDFIVASPSIQYVVISFFGNYALDTSYAADHVANRVGPDTVKITGPEIAGEKRSDLFFYGLNAAISKLEKAGKQVTIATDVPELPFFPKSCLDRPFSTKKKRCAIPIEEVINRQQMIRELFRKVEILHPNVRVFDSRPVTCDASYCYAERDGVYLYRDSHHLSLRGSDAYAKEYFDWRRKQGTD